jgi:hypothetical protein
MRKTLARAGPRSGWMDRIGMPEELMLPIRYAAWAARFAAQVLSVFT